MELDEKEIDEFRILWKRTFNEVLSKNEARTRAQRLIEVYTRLARPLPSELPPQPDPSPHL
jgi:hypothetical protein